MIKKNKKKMCTKCKKEEARKSHSWCLSCFRKYKKKWDNEDKGYYLYIIKNKKKEVLYVGSTEHLHNRLYKHLSCNSNIKELMKSKKWYSIEYLDITKFVNNREELNFLESHLINLYDTEYNIITDVVNLEDDLKMFSLLCELQDSKKFWSVYITREEYKIKKVI